MSLVIRHNGKFVAVFRQGAFTANYPCINTSFCNPFDVTAYPGKYLLEVWGAEGSSIDNKKGGKGGYSRGILNLDSKTQLFINIGGKGQFFGNHSNIPSSNGGGGSYFEDRVNSELVLFYGSGGGATDIRVFANELDKRIIVSGGGGAAGKIKFYNGTSRSYSGGSGGGLVGEDGEGKSNNLGLGGTQNEPIIQRNPGKFGKGGMRGGGGGFFGGSGSYEGNGCGGGSGFVYNMSNSYIKGLSSNFFLTEAETLTGNASIPGVNGKEIIGRSGSGAAKITILVPYQSYVFLITFKKQFHFRFSLLFTLFSINK